MEPTIPWYQSAIVRQQIVQIVVAATALLGVNLGGFDINAALVDIFAGVAGVVGVWTLLTRLFKHSPNLTATAHAKEAELVAKAKLPEKQGGFVRIGMAVCVSLLGLAAIALLQGCAGTAAAYKAAKTLPDTALVITEHYAAIVKEAADIAQNPQTPPEVKSALKAADKAVRPFIVGDVATGKPSLRELSEKYQAVHDAKTQADLQAAVNAAVTELAKLINAVKAARRI